MENPPFVTDIPARNLHFDKIDNLPYELWAFFWGFKKFD